MANHKNDNKDFNYIDLSKFATTYSIDPETTQKHSSNINKKNSKKRKGLIFIFIAFLLFVMIGGGYLIYFIMENKAPNAPSTANFDIQLYTNIGKKPEEGGLYMYNCLPGDEFQSPLKVTNNTVEKDADIFIRFKFYIMDSHKNLYENCIISNFADESKWSSSDDDEFFYYRDVISRDETVIIYNSFKIDEELTNMLNGAQATLFLRVDIVEADMNAVLENWKTCPILWALYMNENHGG